MKLLAESHKIVHTKRIDIFFYICGCRGRAGVGWWWWEVHLALWVALVIERDTTCRHTSSEVTHAKKERKKTTKTKKEHTH